MCRQRKTLIKRSLCCDLGQFKWTRVAYWYEKRENKRKECVIDDLAADPNNWSRNFRSILVNQMNKKPKQCKLFLAV